MLFSYILQALLEDHGRQKELREKREREKKEKELKRIEGLEAARSEDSKRPGYQRLRAQQVLATHIIILLSAPLPSFSKVYSLPHR